MKNIALSVAVVTLGASLFAAVFYFKNNEDTNTCPSDMMMCPDGSSVPRSGPMCEFSVCPQESVTIPSLPVEATPASSTEVAATPTSSFPVQEKTQESFLKKLLTKTSSVIAEAATAVASSISSGVQAPSAVNETANANNPTSNQTPSSATPSQQEAATVSYTVVDNVITDNNNTPVYTIPSSFVSEVASFSSWETHVVNVVAVNEVPPVIGGVPVNGLPGKYYVSVNSFGNVEKCEFSNRIYMLDSVTNTQTLLYEENSDTLHRDDARACNSEMFLLATDAEKLILKYHTINTNMICDSAWSEPEKTWYIDVTNFSLGTKRHVIPSSLYLEAEQEESLCRQNLGQ